MDENNLELEQALYRDLRGHIGAFGAITNDYKFFEEENLDVLNPILGFLQNFASTYGGLLHLRPSNSDSAIFYAADPCPEKYFGGLSSSHLKEAANLSLTLGFVYPELKKAEVLGEDYSSEQYSSDAGHLVSLLSGMRANGNFCTGFIPLAKSFVQPERPELLSQLAEAMQERYNKYLANQF